jgi:ABC-type transporter Mla subunit MlaD
MSRHPADLVPPTPGSSRPYVTVGVLMAIAFAILVGGSIWLRGAGGLVYYAELREAPDLRVGAPVRYRGMTVGLVDDVAFTDTSVRLAIRLRRDDVPIRQGAGVRIVPVGIFGDHELELVPSATPSAPVLPPGSTLALATPDSAQVAEQARARAMSDLMVRRAIERNEARARGTTATPSAPPRRDSLGRP